jgi:hypothetical protein
MMLQGYQNLLDPLDPLNRQNQRIQRDPLDLSVLLYYQRLPTPMCFETTQIGHPIQLSNHHLLRPLDVLRQVLRSLRTHQELKLLNLAGLLHLLHL